MSYDELLMKLNELSQGVSWRLLVVAKDSFKVEIVLEQGNYWWRHPLSGTAPKRKHYTFGLRSHTFDAMWLHIESDLARWANWDKHVST